MEAQAEIFDLSKIQSLPDYPLKIGNITVTEDLPDVRQRKKELLNYFIICDYINISMSHYNLTEEEARVLQAED